MDKKLIDRVDENVVKITKKYIIDMLNATLFSNVLTWNGIDQFNELPILSNEEDKNSKVEQRGALYVHKKLPMALRIVVTASEYVSQRVCYRIVSPKNQFEIEEMRRRILPMEHLYLDFSIADTNLGLVQDSSYSFSYNIQVEESKEKSIIFNLLRFMLDAELIAYDHKELYQDILDDVLSLPPVPGDPHFKPIYGVNKG